MENVFQEVQVHLQHRIVIRILLLHTLGILLPQNLVNANKEAHQPIIQITKQVKITYKVTLLDLLSSWP